jgi:hypothetical protein
MPLTLIYQAPKVRFESAGRVDTLELDASISEVHEIEAEVTEHPVESGFQVSDNVRRKPLRVTIDGIVSNTPIVSGFVRAAQQIQGLYAGNSDVDASRTETAFKTLQRLFDNQTLISVYTKINTYDSMVIKSLRIPRDKSVGDALRFTAVCWEVRVVQAQTVQVSLPRGKGRQRTGKKSPQPAPAAEQTKSSLALQAVKGIGKWFAKP